MTSRQELPDAIAYARKHDPKVIVESAIVGRELECGVLEFPDGTVQASTVGEIRVAGVRGREDSFYDFATKYLDDAAELDVPAKIDDDVSDAVRELAIRAFTAIDGRGSGAGGLLPHRRRAVDQRGQHDARIHHDLDVSPDVGGQRAWTTRPCWRPWWTPRCRGGWVCASSVYQPRDGSIGRAGTTRSISSESCWIGVGPEPGGKRQRHIDRAIHGVPGGSLILADLEPLHPVDDLDRGSDDEFGRTIEAAPQYDRIPGACGLPRGGTDRGRLGQLRPGVVAESLGQCVGQLLASGILRLRRGNGGDDDRRRVVAGRRDRENDADRADRHHQRGDQRRPGRAGFNVGALPPPSARSRRPRTYRCRCAQRWVGSRRSAISASSG